MNVRHWLKMAWKKLLRLLGLKPWPTPPVPPVDPPAPPVEPDPPRPTLPRLHIEGTAFRRPDGSRWSYRGLTSFALLKLIADGKDAEAVKVLDWAASHGITIVRVLSMCSWLKLTPEQGRAALPRLLTLCAERGLYAEVVCLADTAALKCDHHAHVHAIGTLAAQFPAALVELTNEPRHPSQVAVVHDPTYLLALRALIPDGVLVALGAAHGPDDESRDFTGGSYVTVHCDRAEGDGGWRAVRHTREAQIIQAEIRKPVIDDEPAKELDPDKQRAKGMLARVCALGTTFHYEGGKWSRLPTGAELTAFEAWRAGLDALPSTLEEMSSFQNAGWAGCPVAGADFDTVLRVYSAKVGGRCYSVLLNLTGDPKLELRSGWRVDVKKQWGRVALWRLSK